MVPVAVIDGSILNITTAASVSVGQNPQAIVVNEQLNTAYVVNGGSNTVHRRQ